MALPDLVAGTLVLDRYRVLASLPWGHAHRPVALARDLRLAQHVALVFAPAPAGTLAGDLFMRRAEAIAVLPHPAVPPVLDMGLHCGHGVLVYRHITGALLTDTMGQERVIWSVQRTLASVCELAAALGQAHACGIVHGDFGPHSILVEPSGSFTIVDLVWPFIPGAPTRLDTPPEVRRGYAATPRSDVFALGCMLQSLMRVTGSQTTPDLDSAIKHVIWRSTAAAPQARFADGTALARALAPLAAAAAAAPDAPISRSPRPLLQRPRVAVAPATQSGRSLARPWRRGVMPLALGLAVMLAPFADVAMHEILGRGPASTFLRRRDGDGWGPHWQPQGRVWLWRPDPHAHVGTPWDWSRSPGQDGP